MQWFPLFLKQTKLILNFLRNNMSEMVDELAHGGHHLVAKVLQSAKLTNFAQWRWNTLWKVVVAIQKVLATFTN